MAPAHVNREAQKGGNPPDPGKVRHKARVIAQVQNGHKMGGWVKVPTPMRGEEVWVAWCKHCGGALVWRSRISVFALRAEGDVMTQVCNRIPKQGDGQNKT